MLNSVNTWSVMLCSLIMVCSVFEFLIPPGKISKSVNMVLGALMIFFIMMPFTSKNKIKKIDYEKLKEKNI